MLQTTEKPEDALSAEDVRRLCYEVAAEAHLARLAVQSEDDWDNNETLLALNLLFHRWKGRLEEVAGGPTFDRLGSLEENGKAVAS